MNLFPDTNFFLHFRHAQELDWSAFSQAETLTLWVGRAVNKELDKKKHELRGRAQDRAREYTQKLAQVATGSSQVLREAGPRIVLDILPSRPPGWQCPPELEPTWMDDVLVGDILSFRHGSPNAEVALVTGDPGLMAKARLYGIRVIPAHGPEWLLPNENSDQDKELLRLRREVQELKTSGPAINHEAQVNGVVTSAIQFAVIRHPPLTEDDIAVVMAGLVTRHPETLPRPPPGVAKVEPGREVRADAVSDSAEWAAPLQSDVDAYTIAYQRWLQEAETFVREFTGDEPSGTDIVDLDVVLQNSGTRPAERALLYIEVVGGLSLEERPDAKDTGEAIGHTEPRPSKFRRPPAPLTWKRVVRLSPKSSSGFDIATLAGLHGQHDGLSQDWISRSHLGPMDHFSSLLGPLQASLEPTGFHAKVLADIAREQKRFGPRLETRAEAFGQALFIRPDPKPRDRHLFYRSKQSDGARPGQLVYSCEEFRHRLDPFAVRLRLSLPKTDDVPGSAAIKIRLSAANMRAPFDAVVPVKISRVKADTKGIVNTLLPF